MIIFVYGTTAELIKLSPLMHLLDEKQVQYEVWCTGQQFEQLNEAAASLNVRVADVWISKGAKTKSLTRNRQVPLWLLTCLIWLVKNYRLTRQRLRGVKTIVLVHGDTMTTVVGALIGKSLGLKVGHVEAGLRSNDIRNPFPEEIDRRLAAKLSDVHFAPDSIAEANLNKTSGVVINTRGNTSIDALRHQLVGINPAKHTPYGVVLLHRSELLRDRDLLQNTFSVIFDHAEIIDIYVVTDALASAALTKYGLIGQIASISGITLLKKQSHKTFVELIANASFVITDSGGLQEECAALGIPCFVHRKTTERFDGIGANCAITGQDVTVLASMIENFQTYRRTSLIDSTSPSQIIIDYLENSNY